MELGGRGAGADQRCSPETMAPRVSMYIEDLRDLTMVKPVMEQSLA